MFLKEINIYFDGFSSPHKKNISGYAIVVEINDKEEMSYINFNLDGTLSNNYCELQGLKNALEIANKMNLDYSGSCRINILGDSKLAINGYSNLYTIRNPQLKDFLIYFPVVNSNTNVVWISRYKNKAGKLIDCIRK